MHWVCTHRRLLGTARRRPCWRRVRRRTLRSCSCQRDWSQRPSGSRGSHQTPRPAKFIAHLENIDFCRHIWPARESKKYGIYWNLNQVTSRSQPGLTLQNGGTNSGHGSAAQFAERGKSTFWPPRREAFLLPMHRAKGIFKDRWNSTIQLFFLNFIWPPSLFWR